jgi:hypothetical protein
MFCCACSVRVKTWQTREIVSSSSSSLRAQMGIWGWTSLG